MEPCSSSKLARDGQSETLRVPRRLNCVGACHSRVLRVGNALKLPAAGRDCAGWTGTRHAFGLRRCDTQRVAPTPPGTPMSGFDLPWGHHKTAGQGLFSAQTSLLWCPIWCPQPRGFRRAGHRRRLSRLVPSGDQRSSRGCRRASARSRRGPVRVLTRTRPMHASTGLIRRVIVLRGRILSAVSRLRGPSQTLFGTTMRRGSDCERWNGHH